MLRKSDYLGLDLSGRDLRGKDFTNQNLFGTDLRKTRLLGLKISIDCATFDGVKLDAESVGLLLMIIGQSDTDPGWATGIEALVLQQLGERKLKAIRTLLKLT